MNNENIVNAYWIGYFLGIKNAYFSIADSGVKKSLYSETESEINQISGEYKELFNEEIEDEISAGFKNPRLFYKEYFQFVKEKIQNYHQPCVEVSYLTGSIVAVSILSGPYVFEADEFAKVLYSLFIQLKKNISWEGVNELTGQLNSKDIESRHLAGKFLTSLFCHEKEDTFSDITLQNTEYGKSVITDEVYS